MGKEQDREKVRVMSGLVDILYHKKTPKPDWMDRSTAAFLRKLAIWDYFEQASQAGAKDEATEVLNQRYGTTQLAKKNLSSEETS